MSKTQKQPKTNSWLQHLINLISLIITGVGIGWLVGLSVSPVISIVITSVIGSAAAIIAALSGLTSDQKSDEEGEKRNRLMITKPNPVPIAALVVGLVIGSLFGVQARTYDWLEPDIAAKIAVWEKVGIEHDDIRDRMYDLEFPSEAVDSGQTKTNTVNSGDGVLFIGESEECVRLLALTGEDLKNELKFSNYKQLRGFPDVIVDVNLLEQLVEEVICQNP